MEDRDRRVFSKDNPVANTVEGKYQHLRLSSDLDTHHLDTHTAYMKR